MVDAIVEGIDVAGGARVVVTTDAGGCCTGGCHPSCVKTFDI